MGDLFKFFYLRRESLFKGVGMTSPALFAKSFKIDGVCLHFPKKTTPNLCLEDLLPHLDEISPALENSWLHPCIMYLGCEVISRKLKKPTVLMSNTISCKNFQCCSLPHVHIYCRCCVIKVQSQPIFPIFNVLIILKILEIRKCVIINCGNPHKNFERKR